MVIVSHYFVITSSLNFFDYCILMNWTCIASAVMNFFVILKNSLLGWRFFGFSIEWAFVAIFSHFLFTELLTEPLKWKQDVMSIPKIKIHIMKKGYMKKVSTEITSVNYKTVIHPFICSENPYWNQTVGH